MNRHQRMIYVLCRQACPGASDAMIDYVLWNETAFPFVAGRELWRQLWHALRTIRRYRNGHPSDPADMNDEQWDEFVSRNHISAGEPS